MKTEKLQSYLTAKAGSPAEIAEFRQLSGGACQDNYLLHLKAGALDEKLVLRTDKGGALLGSLSRPQEYQVIEKAVAAGVLTPPVKWLSEDASIVGHPFYLMQKIEGTANPREILKNKKIDFKKLAADVATNLAKIHSIKYDPAILPFLDHSIKSQSKEISLSSIAICRKLLDELPGGYPGIELCLNWAEANAPVTDELVLCHSDFRSGNFMVNEGKLTGILDWEFAHWGDRHEDIGYLRMRDWRFGKVKNEIGGFADPDDFYAPYEQASAAIALHGSRGPEPSMASGIKVDREKVRYWEVMGNIRWAIGAAQQGERHLSGKDKGIEFASIGRRVAEMEFEAMRLIEGGN